MRYSRKNPYFKAQVLTAIAVACALGHPPVQAQATNANPIESLTNMVKGLGGFLQNIVSPKGQKLRDLIAEKKYNDAANLYAGDKTYFDSQSGTFDQALLTLSAAMNAVRDQAFKERLQALNSFDQSTVTKEPEWPAARSALEEAGKALIEYDSYELLKDKKYRSQEADKLSSGIDGLKKMFSSKSLEAFQVFNLKSDKSFSDVFPVEVVSDVLMPLGMDYAVNTFSGASSLEIAKFRKQYSSIFKSSDFEKLGDLYIERLLNEKTSKQVTFFDKLDAVRQARSSGFEVGEVRNFKVAYVQLQGDPAETGPKGTLEPNKSVKNLSSSDLTGDPSVNSADYLVLIQPLPVEIKRRILDKRRVSSQYQTGMKDTPNPAYSNAQAKFIQAQGQYNAHQLQSASQPAYGAAAGLLKGIANGIMSASVTKARNELESLSPTITEPVMSNYQFDVTRIQVDRLANFRVLIVDRLTKTIAKQEIPTTESKIFELAYNLQDQDPSFNRYRSDYVDEKAIDIYEQNNTVVKSSWLAQQVVEAGPAFAPMQSESLAFTEIIQQPLRKVSATTMQAESVATQLSINEDPRIGSVVVVRNLKGGLGSGFYVAPDVILTNYHVIEGTQTVELNRSSGPKFVGRVFKSDIGLDLALIRVQENGRPVQFSSSPLSTGATVEAIGHPSGLEFTITRGIISAIRKTRNPLVRGSNEMLVIQTDAAISPGNSGGPLFVGNQVVGVNSQKLVKTGVEGIGFAVHYAEVQRFIQEP